MDPDRWLASIHGQAFARTVQPNGSVVVDITTIISSRPGWAEGGAGRQRAGAAFDVLLGREVVKSVAIKGLVGQPLPFEEYAARMLEEARSEYRRWLQQQRLLQLSLWAS